MHAHTVASYLLTKNKKLYDRETTHLKLQKLLYYSQGFHLAIRDEPVFRDNIQAWRRGPVIPRVYLKYHLYRHEPIPAPKSFDTDDLLPETQEILDAVLIHYGKFDPNYLSHLTHSHKPWCMTQQSGIIPQALLKDFFSEIVQAGLQGQAVKNEPIWSPSRFHFQKRQQIANRLAKHRSKLQDIARRTTSKPSVIDDEDWLPSVPVAGKSDEWTDSILDE